MALEMLPEKLDLKQGEAFLGASGQLADWIEGDECEQTISKIDAGASDRLK